jgi:ribonuclease HII
VNSRRAPDIAPDDDADEHSGVEIGIDEAGRGPILGPMVLCCVALDGRGEKNLAERGVTDSKCFGAGERAHKARAELARAIEGEALHIGLAVVEVSEIDAHTMRGELNVLEREHAARLLTAAPVSGRVVADGARVFGPLRSRFPRLLAKDRAELEHVAVAAASIVAKVARDEAWFRICEAYRAEFGELLVGFAGGGYLNDATRRFLRAYVTRYGCLPREARTSWTCTFLDDLLPAQRGLSLF